MPASSTIEICRLSPWVIWYSSWPRLSECMHRRAASRLRLHFVCRQIPTAMLRPKQTQGELLAEDQILHGAQCS
jgi:hypothetical protein